MHPSNNHVVVSQNRGTPIKTPIYYSPYYGDPENGTPDFGKSLCRVAASSEESFMVWDVVVAINRGNPLTDPTMLQSLVCGPPKKEPYLSDTLIWDFRLGFWVASSLDVLLSGW